MAECPAIVLGFGTTPTHPCTTVGVDPFSIEVCSAYDYLRVRSVAVIKNNELVVLLNRFAELVKEGKASWDTVTKLALDQHLAAWDTFQIFNKEYFTTWNWLTTSEHLGHAEATSKLALLAEQLHGAVCGVRDAVAATGEAVPQLPDPPKEPLTIGETFVNFAESIATGVAWLFGGGLILYVGYQLVTRMRGR